MASEDGKGQENQSEELNAWISGIPFSKPKKNLTRDFSDAVLMAEVLKVYYPRYVDLHNYASANNINSKKENWNTLNRKVFAKIDMKLTKETINQLANSHPGAAENLLLEVKNKVSTDPSCTNKDSSLDEQGNNDECSADAENEANVTAASGRNELISQTTNCDTSTFARAKQRILFTLKWLIHWLCVWNYFYGLQKFRLPKTPLINSQNDVSSAQTGNEEDSVPRQMCTQLRQELREKEDIIATLNHKVAYLESAMKLKDLRISNLTAQILQNAVETELLAKASGGVQTKPRPRPQNIPEIKLKD